MRVRRPSSISTPIVGAPRVPWSVLFGVTATGTLGAFLVADRYVDLLAAGVAYFALWVIAGRDRSE